MANTEATQGAKTVAASAEGAALGPDAQKALKALVECLALRAAFDEVGTFQGATLKPASLSFYDFLSQRTAGTSKVRAFNPTEVDDGWNSDNTIITGICLCK